MKAIRKRQNTGALAAFALAAVSIAVLTEWALYSQNTLLHNGRWMIGKRLMQMAVIDDDELLYNRVPLAGNRLNLGSWWGFQKIVSRAELDPARIDFSFKLSRDSYVNLLIGESDAGFTAVRLSSLAGVSSAVLEVENERSVTRRATMPPVGPDAWKEASIEVSGSELGVRVDGKELFRGKISRGLAGRFGFWGGYHSVLIDRVAVRTRDGQSFVEDFSNSRQRGWYAAFAALFVFLVWGVAFLSTRRFFESGVMSMATLAVVACAILAFDRLYWSPHPGNVLRWGGASSFAPWYERARFGAFKALASLAGDETPSHQELGRLGYPLPGERIWRGPVYCGSLPGRGSGCFRTAPGEVDALLTRPRRGPRILFSGSSQTLGAGALRLEKTFFARVYSTLAKKWGPGSPLEMLNIGVDGDHVENQFSEFNLKYARFAPGLLVLNWSTNDAAPGLEKGLVSFLELARSRGIRALLVLEPNSLETGTEIAEKHRIVRALSEKYRVPLLDLQEAMKDPKILEDGFTWWDYVHFTDIGHRLAAERLAPRIAELMTPRGP